MIDRRNEFRFHIVCIISAGDDADDDADDEHNDDGDETVPNVGHPVKGQPFVDGRPEGDPDFIRFVSLFSS